MNIVCFATNVPTLCVRAGFPACQQLGEHKTVNQDKMFCANKSFIFIMSPAIAQDMCYTQLFLSLVLSNYSFYVCPSAPTDNT
ncbi:MAG: hypothetical protein ACK52X_03330, partial [bacterium]